jgi:hypothetical protein
MSTLNHAEMHRDHLLWLGENNLWRDNLRVWQAELKQLVEESTDLQALLDAHQQRLQVHAAAIRAHEQDPRQHEHDIAEYEKGETDANLIALASRHQSEALERQEQRAAHLDLNREHYAIVTHWHAFLRALRESAEHAPRSSGAAKVKPGRTRIEL